ncbi:MAG: PHB depolymerase family esterase [Hyphomicrobiales bacterium]|nr:PHB depolymerase family esterase [Hyphomicrobiales bacterium]
MNAFARIDFREVTRLAQAGRFAEAMALLKGGKTPDGARDASGTPRPAKSGKRSWPAIDMMIPSIQRRASTTPRQAKRPTVDASAGLEGDLAPTMRAFRDILAKPRSLRGLEKGLGSGLQALAPVPDGARFEERTFSNHAGSRTYKVFVPSGYRGQALPVVVMLHGCTQNPDDFAIGTRMNELAEEQTFLVAYPRQPESANVQKCWNWFKVGDQRREGGEPSLIAGIASAVVAEFSADPTRVYVAGMSAGGAAAAIMAATYPDLFAAVGIHSGLACGAAKDIPSAFAAMGGGGAVRRRGEGPSAPTIVFHGDGDRTVNPVNGDHVVAQASPDAPLTKVVYHGQTSGGLTYTRTVQADDAGREVLEQWVVHGAGHAWSGGSARGSYTEPRGPDASAEMMRFFLAHANPTAAG